MRKKLLKISVGGMIVFLVSVAVAKTTLETPTTDVEFEKIVGELKVEAKAFAGADNDKGPTQSKVVAKLQYSPKSSVPLGKAIKSPPPKPLERMYILCQLLQPLKMSADETIRPHVPALIDFLGKDCRYKSMPKWTKDTLKLLSTTPNPAEPAERSKHRAEARRKKIADERAVVKYNRAVNALEKTIKQLLVLPGDPDADEALLKRLESEEKDRLATFEETLAIIKSEAGRMKPDRAKKFYDRLKASALRSKRPMQYSDPTKPVYKADKKSSFESRKVHFAVSALKVVNILATAAKEPAMKIPGEKPPKKRRPKRPRR